MVNRTKGPRPWLDNYRKLQNEVKTLKLQGFLPPSSKLTVSIKDLGKKKLSSEFDKNIKTKTVQIKKTNDYKRKIISDRYGELKTITRSQTAETKTALNNALERHQKIKPAAETIKRVFKRQQELRKKRNKGEYWNERMVFNSVQLMTKKQTETEIKNFYSVTTKAFKANVRISILVQNIQTKEYKNFFGSYNTAIYKRHYLIKNIDTLNLFIEKLNNESPEKLMQGIKVDTKWRFVRVTGYIFDYYKTDYNIGFLITLPEFLKLNKSIIGLTGYDDNLCFFRCIEYHNKLKEGKTIKKDRLNTITRQYFADTYNFHGIKDYKDFEGVRIIQIEKYEKLFNLNINVFRLDEQSRGEVILKSSMNYEDMMNLNLYVNNDTLQSHFSYITNIEKYAGNYSCKKCEKLF